MSPQRAIRYVPLFLPLIGFFLIVGLPNYSGRLSVLLHGIPFAHVTKAEVFKYVQTDNLRNAGIVVSDGRAIGWIYQPISSFARFVPFTGKPSLDNSGDIDVCFDFLFLTAWTLRWWLLAAQILLVVYWFGFRKRRVQNL